MRRRAFAGFVRSVAALPIRRASRPCVGDAWSRGSRRDRWRTPCTLATDFFERGLDPWKGLPRVSI